MSNIVKAIVATDTGERKFIKEKTSQLFRDVFSGREEISDIRTQGDIGKFYRISVTLGNSALVPDHSMVGDEHALHDAINRTKRQVIEAIFGEFRQDFRMIERLLYNYDFEGAATALRAMEDKMYSTE